MTNSLMRTLATFAFAAGVVQSLSGCTIYAESDLYGQWIATADSTERLQRQGLLKSENVPSFALAPDGTFSASAFPSKNGSLVKGAGTWTVRRGRPQEVQFHFRVIDGKETNHIESISLSGRRRPNVTYYFGDPDSGFVLRFSRASGD